jgi:hypothetical protein
MGLLHNTNGDDSNELHGKLGQLFSALDLYPEMNVVCFYLYLWFCMKPQTYVHISISTTISKGIL